MSEGNGCLKNCSHGLSIGSPPRLAFQCVSGFFQVVLSNGREFIDRGVMKKRFVHETSHSFVVSAASFLPSPLRLEQDLAGGPWRQQRKTRPAEPRQHLRNYVSEELTVRHLDHDGDLFLHYSLNPFVCRQRG